MNHYIGFQILNLQNIIKWLINIKTFTDFDTKLNEHLIDETEAYEYAMNTNINIKIIKYLLF